MSRHARAACASLVLLALAGCGGQTQAAPAAPDVAPSRAKAVAAAKAINLTLEDLPLFKRDPAHKDRPGEKDYDALFAKCLGVPTATVGRVADVDVSFSDRFRQVVSDVDVKRNLPRVHQDVTALRAPGGAACVGKTLMGVISDGLDAKASVSTPRVTAFTPDAALHAPDSYGFDVTADVTVPQGTVPVHLTLMGFAVKHSEVTLMVMSLGRAFPSDQRDGLFATLVDNAARFAV